MPTSGIRSSNALKNDVGRRVAVWSRRVLLALCMVLCGCGTQNPRTATVRGVVTVDGKAVTTGKIVFYPQQGRPAMGKIGADGSYELTTFNPQDGAIVGEHRVSIEAVVQHGVRRGPQTFEEELQGVGFSSDAKIEWLVPQRYSRRQTSPLTAEVTSDANTINFDL